MTPDEIACLFDRSSGRQIIIIDGVPVALLWTNYDQDAQFAVFLRR